VHTLFSSQREREREKEREREREEKEGERKSDVEYDEINFSIVQNIYF
jgi:hypothetical protein